MKSTLLVACSLTLLLSPVANAVDQVEEIVTLRGRTYRDCRISQVHPDGVSFFHAKGAAKVLFTELPNSWKKKFGYNEQRAEEFQREVATRQFLEQERREQAHSEAAERERRDFEARLRLLEQATLLQQQRLLLQQQQMAVAGYPGIAAPVPAVGWPADFYGYGPMSEIQGPAFGGSRWCRGRPRVASIGCGSGGVLTWTGWSGYGFTRSANGLIWNSPTLGRYYVGGGAGAWGGAGHGHAGYGRACSTGFTGLSHFGAAPAMPCAPVRCGSVAIPVAR